MPAPSVVVFDLGKVFVDFDYRIAARKIAARGTASPDEVWRFINHSPLIRLFESGLIPREKLFAEVCRVTGFTGTIREFAEFFGAVFTPIEPMIRLHAVLRRRGMPTYIFSNTNEFAVESIQRNFPFFGDFDGYVFSYENGAMKPDAKLYQVVERQAGRHGAEILYLDDLAENVAAGAARGWQALLQESPEKTWAAFRQRGLVTSW